MPYPDEDDDLQKPVIPTAPPAYPSPQIAAPVVAPAAPASAYPHIPTLGVGGALTYPQAPAPAPAPQPAPIQTFAPAAGPAASTFTQAAPPAPQPAPLAPQVAPTPQQVMANNLAQYGVHPFPANYQHPSGPAPQKPGTTGVFDATGTAFSAPIRKSAISQAAGDDHDLIPGIEGFAPEKSFDDQSSHILGTVASGAKRLPNYLHDDRQVSQAAAPTATPGTSSAKLYTVGGDRTLRFDPANPTKSVLAALRDGAIDDNAAEKALEAAKQVQSAKSELEKMAGEHPELKALGEGLTTGAAFLGGGTAAAAAGNLGLNEAIGAATAPISWATVPAANLVEFLGGGMMAAWAKKKLEGKLAAYSDAVKSFQAAAELHPGYALAGELLPQLPMAGASVRNLGKLGQMAIEDLGAGASTAQKAAAAARAVARPLAGGAAGGALAEGVARPAVSYAADAALDAAGIEHEQTQAPTLGSVTQMAALGALLSAHPTEFGSYDRNQMASILSRGTAHSDLNVPHGEVIPPEKMAARYGNNPNVDNQTLAHFGQPLTSAEQEIFFKALRRVKEMQAAGTLPRGQAFEGTAKQATQNGQPIDVTALKFGPKEAAPRNGSSSTDPGAGPIQSLEAGNLDNPGHEPSPSQAPAAPASRAAARVSSGPTTPIVPSASGQPAQSGANGQASSNDDAAHAENLKSLVQQRDGTQMLLDQGKISPEALEATRGLVAHLTSQIDASRQVRPARPATRGESLPVPAPAEPAPAVHGESPESASAAEDSAEAAPARGEAGTSVRDEGPGAREGNSIAPATDHEALAERVNAGHASDHKSAPASAAHEVLHRIREHGGQDITPDTARGVSERVSGILDDATLDRPAKQAALKALVREHAPAKPAQAPAAVSTIERVRGNRLDDRRSTFSPESGTLGIPRKQMPQVAAEHRGAMANFLKARGMAVSEADVSPGSLKPSQADYNPGKVAKAGSIREAGDATPRRILVSNDGHVVDGHHQWLDRLEHAPDETMPVLKIDAPARDILRQIHEFPSAGMEKAADLPSQPAGGESTVAAPERQPATRRGKSALTALQRLARLREQGVPINPWERSAQRQAELTLARDLNEQVLGADAPPTSEAGKHAKQRLDDLSSHLAGMNPGQLLEIHGLRMEVENDRTAQRLAIEQKQASQPGGKPTAAPKFSAFDEAAPVIRQAAREKLAASQQAGQEAPAMLEELARVDQRKLSPVGQARYLQTAARADAQHGLDLAGQGVTLPLPTQPVSTKNAINMAMKLVGVHRSVLNGLGVRDISYSGTRAPSGIEFAPDGTLYLDPAKLAASMETVGKNQATLGIKGTPDDWFTQVLVHEGIHAADAAVAKAKGQTIQQRYESLPEEAMPEGWEKAGRDVYGAKQWDALPEWKQKAEFVRQVVEGKYTGRLTEALYKFIHQAIDYLKRVAGFEKADPRFRAHVEEVEARIEAARAADKQALARAEADYRAELMRDAQQGSEDAGAIELLDAIRAAGGLPTQDSVFGGELNNIREAGRPGAIAGYKGTFNLFRKGASSLGNLTRQLREQGFEVDTPAELLDLVHQRLHGQRPIHAYPARAEAQSGMAGAGSLAAARPDRETGDLFGAEHEPFNLVHEHASAEERHAAARESSDRSNALGAAQPEPARPDRDLRTFLNNARISERESARLAKRWQALAESDAAFRHGKQIESGSPDAIARHYSRAGQELSARRLPAAELSQARRNDGAVSAVEFTNRREDLPREGKTTVYLRDDGTGFIDSSEADSAGQKAAGGDQAYQAALSLLHNQGLKRVADPQGVSDIASVRVTSQMLSSALRHETTAHLEPGAGQDLVLPWKEGDHEHNVASLALSELRNVARVFPEILSFKLDEKTGKISGYVGGKKETFYRDPTEAGRRGAKPLSSLVGEVRSRADANGVGEATLARAIVTRATFPDLDSAGLYHDRLGDEQAVSARVAARLPTGGLTDASLYAAKPEPVEEVAPPAFPTRRGSTQLTLSPEQAKPFVNFARSIPERFIYSEKDAAGKEQYGRELEPHVTSLFGLTGKGDNTQAVQGAAANHGPITVRLGKLSVFSNPDAPYDVLKVDVHSPALHALNERLRGLEHKSDYPDYKPHLTIAYVKKGEAANIIAKYGSAFEDRNLTFEQLDHSSGEDRTKTPVALATRDEAARAKIQAHGVRLSVQAQRDELTSKQAGGETLTAQETRELEAAKAWLAEAKETPGQADARQRTAAQAALDELSARQERGETLTEKEARLIENARQRLARPTVSGEAEGGTTSTAAQSAEIEPSKQPAAGVDETPLSLRAQNARNALDVIDAWEQAGKPLSEGQVRARQDAERVLTEEKVSAREADVVQRRTAQGVLDRLSAKQTEGGTLSPEETKLAENVRARLAKPAVSSEAEDADSRLGAATPEDIDPSEAALFGEQDAPAPTPAKKGNVVERASAAVSAAVAKGKQTDAISHGFDSARTRAGVEATKAGRSIRYDIKDGLDRQGALALVEAGYDPKVLAADLARVQASPDKKLAARYAPAYRHALANLPRLREAAEGWRQLDLQQDAAAEQAGLPPSWRARYKHLWDDPTSPESTVAPDNGFGASKGFQTAVDAIAAGVDPHSLDLADYAERRVRLAQRAINEKAFHAGLREMKAPDGKPLLGSIEESSSTLEPDGSVSSSVRVPKGYRAVQAGDNVLVAHRDAAPLLESLYGTSKLRGNAVGDTFMDVVALAKHGTAVLDSYHGFKVLFKEVLGYQTVGYKKGLAVLELSEADLARAVEAGDFTKEQADYANANRPTVERGLRAGLNVDGMADNLLEAARQHNLVERLPLVGPVLTKVNHLIFRKLGRGAMVQAYVVGEARNRARHPKLGEAEVARKTAKEVNEFFGNLGNQGFLKDKTMQDTARVFFFAPQWTEATFRSEARGVAQGVKAVADGVTGKGWRVGVIAQALGGTILASLIANQAINLFSKGTPTWENEEGHRWDAWIPGGANNRGFWFSPLAIAAEYSHALHKYMEGGESALDAAAHIGANKLSGPARGLKDLVTGEDYAGRPFGSMGERLTAAVTDTLPSPMPLGAAIRKDPKQPLGYGLNHEPGALEKQLLASLGIKVDNARSARAKMFQAAQPFRADSGSHGSSPYSSLRRMLDQGDMDGAASEVGRLLKQEGKAMKDIRRAMSIGEDGSTRDERFTGSHKAEMRMLHGFSPEQRKVYAAAQREHRQIANRFRAVAARGGAAAPAGH